MSTVEPERRSPADPARGRGPWDIPDITLGAFLLARWQEEEDAARGAIEEQVKHLQPESIGRALDPGEDPAQWNAGTNEDGEPPYRYYRAIWAAEGWTMVAEVLGDEDRATAEHIARHDPARVLAEVEAKRRLVARIFWYEAKIDGEWDCCHSAQQIEQGHCSATPVNEIEALRLLALPYARHDRYDPTWSPDQNK